MASTAMASTPSRTLPGLFSPSDSLSGIDGTFGHTTSLPQTPKTAPTLRQAKSCDNSPKDYTVSTYNRLNLQRPHLAEANSESAVLDIQEIRRHLEWKDIDKRSRGQASGAKSTGRRASNPEGNNRVHKRTKSRLSDVGSSGSPRQRVPPRGDDPDPSTTKTTPIPEVKQAKEIKIPETAREVHDELQSFLRKQFTTNNSKGHIYIFRDMVHGKRIKIGSSDNVSRRKGDIVRECGMELKLMHVSQACMNRIKTEHLIHRDLGVHRRPFYCSVCEKMHTEWFSFPNKYAEKTVDRWVAFMQHEPYQQSAKLKDMWEHVISRRMSRFHIDNKISDARRWSHWESILVPITMLEQLMYVYHTSWPGLCFLWQYNWQIAVFVLGTRSWLWERTVFTFFLAVVSFMCSSFSIFSSIGSLNKL
ncbi:hypothetical protein BU24DRAFT_418911 [Aaosphaeria arxii CBS 175.79]|uniref:Bacteriophage T5 Orf172 DNA-binding domain-containing protein n=1 Tax=Aaosphaeria arxii CBS 175.79 TaxID=1450172 RepID=A0A6A5Y2Q7_9PLEO|nr:uncharacterized protein BU24DRAFT_418911 [Aaosphaeria arxii CBS 175.79]KAF2019317.1 hypothetical protein BU24DRAFT_418911 [Aaosphaeria arxii CBS 175.79]